jgi:transcription initiation factor TFIIH subunit 4
MIGNPLQIAVLNLFVSFKARFSNMIVGTLTRESVKKALTSGITADQVILVFLRVRAELTAS